MNKALLLLLAFALLVGINACGGEEEEEVATPPQGSPAVESPAPSAGPVTINFWHSETASNVDNLEKLAKRFEAEQDEVRVRPLYQGTSDELMTKLLASFGTGQVPALIWHSEIQAQMMIDSGRITPVQDFMDAEDYDLSGFDQRAIDYYTVEGTLYAMPDSLAVPLMFYNKVPFREVGLDPEQPPTDLDEVLAVSEKLLKRDSAGNVVLAGVALDIEPWDLDLTFADHDDLFVNNNNGRDGRATEVLFDSPTGEAFFRWRQDIMDNDLALYVGVNTSGADDLLALGARKAVIAFSTSAALRSVVDVLEGGQFPDVEVGVAAMPGVAGGSGLPGVYTRALWISNERPPEEQEAAWKFIQWLMEPEQQAEWFAGSGYLPVVPSAYDLEQSQQIMEKYPLFRVPVDLSLAAPSTPAHLGPIIGPFLEIRNIVADAMEEVAVGGKDADEALADAAAQANEALADYNRRVAD
jgi:sn-glycerol 3-phosphate transport system substrate-binding protein